MVFNFAALRYQPPVESFPANMSVNESKVGVREVIGERLSAEAVINAWKDRSATQESYNDQLVMWWNSQESPQYSLRRYCDLIAAADLSMSFGTYIEPIIRPLIKTH